MSDDDDFFDGEAFGGYDDGDDGTISSRRVRRERRRAEAARRRGDVLGAKGRRLGHVASAVGVLAMLAGLASAIHEIAPGAIGVLKPVPGRWIALTAGVLVVLTIVLIAVARHHTPWQTSRTSVGTGGIVALLAAVLLLVVGVAVGILFPQGIVKEAVRDDAPISSTQEMKAGLEAAGGPCAGGWTDIPTSGYPGIASASACMDTTDAYAVFDSPAAAAMGQGLVRGQIVGLLDDHADKLPAGTEWRLLSGKEWMAFGPRQTMEKLQRAWGGTLATIDVDGSADAGAAAQ
ncbi:hypothetical protein H7U32_07970 [Bifidobacterium pullorum subsp. saeculare]|uniref:Uncharacterized protein n=1 Tax=Bifidobacterium pullorum subsp. saeculare TaxID=78257 RepID=A0A938WYJ8_9BIFI|nr:hypothetical protein [Bifidobacterium pullorum]MBM6700226.1 hypothetical protein [Bifidobacterium pullorum subsp. saeculare]